MPLTTAGKRRRDEEVSKMDELLAELGYVR